MSRRDPSVPALLPPVPVRSRSPAWSSAGLWSFTLKRARLSPPVLALGVNPPRPLSPGAGTSPQVDVTTSLFHCPSLRVQAACGLRVTLVWDGGGSDWTATSQLSPCHNLPSEKRPLLHFARSLGDRSVMLRFLDVLYVHP